MFKPLKSEDCCLYCHRCKIWKTNFTKANCELHRKPDGFHPEDRVPRQCIGDLFRK
jgi:hypothetical protein